ncbi:MAG: hypothetical protein U1F46_14220 [Marinagarivorans sp.]
MDLLSQAALWAASDLILHLMGGIKARNSQTPSWVVFDAELLDTELFNTRLSDKHAIN